MNQRFIFYTVFVGCAMAGLCHAEQPSVPGPTRLAQKATPQTVRIPATDYEIAVGARETATHGTQPPQALLKAIVTWLANDFGLPRNDSYPAIKRESAAKITTFRHTGLLSDSAQDRALVPQGQREVVAAYDPLTKTILLPEHWTGGTPADLSILVHEMVHHLQHGAGLKYPCPQASEELAYAAQDKFLRLFGRSLAGDFQIDGFTLLASTTCIY